MSRAIISFRPREKNISSMSVFPSPCKTWDLRCFSEPEQCFNRLAPPLEECQSPNAIAIRDFSIAGHRPHDSRSGALSVAGTRACRADILPPLPVDAQDRPKVLSWIAGNGQTLTVLVRKKE
jgi:hypothetical protein